jgi:hypothetical protein
MPHEPRRYPNTIGVPVELLQQPQASHAPIPIRAPEQRQNKNTLALQKISMKNWDRNPDEIFQSLFGMEAETDDIGHLVYPEPKQPGPAGPGCPNPTGTWPFSQ